MLFFTMTGLLNLHDETFKRLPTSLPMFQKIEKESEKKDTQAKLKHNKMVEVNQNGKKFIIHKTTAVWLLQESECVSTDCLFRVRAKQPNMNYSQYKMDSHYHSSLVPIKIIFWKLVISVFSNQRKIAGK